MVDVGPVSVNMCHFFMYMEMRMRSRSRSICFAMQMFMMLIMTMLVIMFNGLMGMQMPVNFVIQEKYAGKHQ